MIGLFFQVPFYAIIMGLLIVAFFTTFTVVALFLLAIGFWPSLICTVGLTAVTIIRVPVVIFNHIVVTYQSANMSIPLKIVSFVICPVHLMIPLVAFIIFLFSLLPSYTLLSYLGFPLLPWKTIAINHQKMLKRLGTVPQVPENWSE